MISKKEEISPILVSRSLNNRSNTIYLYICLDSPSDPCQDCAFVLVAAAAYCDCVVPTGGKFSKAAARAHTFSVCVPAYIC